MKYSFPAICRSYGFVLLANRLSVPYFGGNIGYLGLF